MVSLGLALAIPSTQDLRLHTDGPALGTVIEIKEERGFGTTLMPSYTMAFSMPVIGS